MLSPNSPQRDAEPDSTSTKRHIVCVLVALDTIRAGTFSLAINNAVLIKDFAVEQVEDVS